MEERIKSLASELERISKELSIISELISCFNRQEPATPSADIESFLSGSSYVVVDSPTGFDFNAISEAE